MEKIEITKENYLAYKNLYCCKLNAIPNDKKLKAIISEFCLISCLLIFGIGTSITTFLANITSDLIQAIIMVAGSIGTMSSMGVVMALGIPKITEKYIRNKYPDLNFDINIVELATKLEKYEKLSTIPENIDKQKEECISNIQSTEFNNLTPRQQIELLEKTKEIILQSKTKQELTKENINEVGYQKKLGNINK